MSLITGSTAIPVQQVVAAPAGGDAADPANIVVQPVQMPRALTALLAGASLGIAGLHMQTLSRNPLADPLVLGILSAASLGVAMGVLGTGFGATAGFGAGAGVRGDAVVTLAAFAGAAIVLALVLAVSARIASPPQLGRYVHTSWWGALSDADHVAISWAEQSVGIGQLINRDSSRLSDGERQCVMIARAIAQQPSRLVLDEPTACLDVTSRGDMRRLRNVASTFKTATLVSTHDLELALRTADRIVLPGRAAT